MEILIGNQNKAVIFSILLGLFVGLLYDIFKLARKLVLPQGTLKKLFKKKDGQNSQFKKINANKVPKRVQTLIVVVFDLTFCLLLCPIFCVFTYITVNGRFRWFIFAAAFLGALIYKMTFGRPFGVIIDYISYFSFRFRFFAWSKIKIPLIKLSGKIKKSKALKKKSREESKRKKARKTVFSYGKIDKIVYHQPGK